MSRILSTHCTGIVGPVAHHEPGLEELDVVARQVLDAQVAEGGDDVDRMIEP